jgi:hypothetical protein
LLFSDCKCHYMPSTMHERGRDLGDLGRRDEHATTPMPAKVARRLGRSDRVAGKFRALPRAWRNGSSAGVDR